MCRFRLLGILILDFVVLIRGSTSCGTQDADFLWDALLEDISLNWHHLPGGQSPTNGLPVALSYLVYSGSALASG